jgi:cytochrome d ubiquinol oxidase subunit I
VDVNVVLLSRIQSAFVVAFQSSFRPLRSDWRPGSRPSRACRSRPENPVYRRLFDFWLKVFAVSFGMGVVSGIVMTFQFGTNWSVLAESTGSIQGRR